MKPERLVIKVGTSVLTRPNQHLDYNVVHQIVEQIGRLNREGHQVVLVTSGAAGASHGLGDFATEKDALKRRQMMTAVGQPRLMQLYSDFFREHHLTIAQALLTRYDFGNRERYLTIREVFEGLLRRQVVPIVNENDVVTDEALTFGDNDYLAASVASMIDADRLFLLSTAGGFYEGGDPRTTPEAHLLPEVPEITEAMWASCQATLSSGGRGGMLSKLKSTEMATSFGIQVYIASGKEVDVVPRIMAGEALGTHFHGSTERPRSFRQWLRFGALTTGRVTVDAGAVKALRDNKSLLPAGIRKVEGRFQAGDIVEVRGPEGEKLGVGVVDLAQEDLKAVMGEAAKGQRHAPAIHKDRLLLV